MSALDEFEFDALDDARSGYAAHAALRTTRRQPALAARRRGEKDVGRSPATAFVPPAYAKTQNQQAVGYSPRLTAGDDKRPASHPKQAAGGKARGERVGEGERVTDSECDDSDSNGAMNLSFFCLVFCLVRLAFLMLVLTFELSRVTVYWRVIPASSANKRKSSHHAQVRLL